MSTPVTNPFFNFFAMYPVNAPEPHPISRTWAFFVKPASRSFLKI
jgi:hypothetical protein